MGLAGDEGVAALNAFEEVAAREVFFEGWVAGHFFAYILFYIKYQCRSSSGSGTGGVLG